MCDTLLDSGRGSRAGQNVPTILNLKVTLSSLSTLCGGIRMFYSVGVYAPVPIPISYLYLFLQPYRLVSLITISLFVCCVRFLYYKFIEDLDDVVVTRKDYLC